jgi:hypothetical protein
MLSQKASPLMPTAKRYDLIFSSDRFNVSEPREYFINDCCYGDDVARWLVELLRERVCTVSEPDQEDWGWCFGAQYQGARYFVGVGGTAVDEVAGNNRGEWRLMVEKHRTLRERWTGANQMEEDDPFLGLLKEIVAGEPDIALVGVE